MDKSTRVLRLSISEVTRTDRPDGVALIKFETSRGVLRGLLHEGIGPYSGVVMVGGVGGGFNGPAGGMYPLVADEIAPMGAVSLRLDYRKPTEFEECILDTMAGISFLESLGITDIGLVGHSLGGAVVIEAGVSSESVKTVVAISSQTHGTRSVPKLSPRSLLLIHGGADEVLPSTCSEEIYRRALEPKELIIYPDDDHVLSKSKDAVRQKIVDWLLTHLPISMEQTDQPKG